MPQKWTFPLAALLCGLLALALSSAPALAKPPYAEFLLDPATGAVLHAHNADVPTQPASLTKIMTLFLAFDALERGELRLDQRLPVSRRAAGMAPSRLGVPAGKTLKTEDAILALVTKSANDVAVVIAEALGGTEERFAEMMTAKARELGMAATTFRNASGLPNSRQVTTARDMARLSVAVIERHPRRYSYFSRSNFSYNGAKIRSHNRLMTRYYGMDGIKTGFVNASGFNLAASAVRDGRRLIAVVLGGPTAAERDRRVAALLDRGFGGQAPMLVASADLEPAVTPAAAVPFAAPKPPGKPVAAAAPLRQAAKGAYTIQVGTYLSAKAARLGLDITRKRLAASLPDEADGTVVQARGKRFLAHFSGLSEAAARSACRRLEAKGQDCLVLASG
ncbi:D-alanyl-D-alanine carboxypeptidase family protein [Arenibaculum sp.]|uniref:D-alanyl-D-alanine carboxypeptidase family protein n=1 Tax=Arenibaculum sp. TaxID=2865862 RepID=UPI002E118020|nr:D-alanyl-D-alanine carboxypeptidase family protein [Arenibaculum sp.]